MQTLYRVTWLNSNREAESIDVHSMRQAQQTALQLVQENNDRVEVSRFVPHLFHELTIRFAK